MKYLLEALPHFLEIPLMRLQCPAAAQPVAVQVGYIRRGVTQMGQTFSRILQGVSRELPLCGPASFHFSLQVFL